MVNRNEKTEQIVAEQREIYDRRYASETRLALQEQPLDFLDLRIRQSLALLPTQPAILDVGCGSGTLLVRRCLPDFSLYVGVDISKTALRIARNVAIGKPSGFVQAVAGDLAFADNSFDAVLAISVIEHIPDPDRFVATVARLLKPCGQVTIHTPNSRDLFTVDGFLRRFLPKIYAGRTHAVGHDYNRFLSPDAVGRILASHGLRVTRLQYTDTLFEWLWVHLAWPTGLALARRLMSSDEKQGETSPVTQSNQQALGPAVRLYNSLIFPLVRVMCWPDRLIELTGHSGGYVVTARKE